MKLVKIIFVKKEDLSLSPEAVINRYNGAKVYNFVTSDAIQVGHTIQIEGTINYAFIVSIKIMSEQELNRLCSQFSDLKFIYYEGTSYKQKPYVNPIDLLKLGDIVDTRNRGRYMVVRVVINGHEENILLSKDDFMYLSSYDSNLCLRSDNHNYDIKAIYASDNYFGSGFDIINDNSLRCVWKR